MRMKFTQTQKELLAMLPQDLQNSKELTDSAKLVLGNIIFLYGMEYAQNNGYVFRTNIKMMEETGIKSEHTLIFAIKKLESLGFIETKRGKRKEASTYKLIKNCSNNLEKCSNNCSETQQKCSNNCSEIETLQNQLLLLQKEIVLLQKEIENIKKCSNNFKNCSTESDTDIETDIDKEKYNNKSILEHKDLVRIVTEENKKEKNNKKEKVSEMELNDKVTSTQVHPSSLNEDNKSGVSDKNIYIPKNTDSSITSPSDDDMDMESYTSMDLEKRGIKERKRTSTVNANKATGDVENTSMNNLSTSVEKTQPDAKEVAKTESEAKIASIMSNIDLDKEGMLKAKSQMQFDAYFYDFKSKLANLQHLVSEEAYKNYRKIQGKWWKATVKYLKYFKDAKKPQQPQQPTTGELKYYQYHLESMFIAKSVDDMDKALNQMSKWFEKMNGAYSSSVMEKYEERFAEDCARVAKTNPIFKEWQNKATGEAEAA